MRTQHGIYQPAVFDDLPGWQEDDPAAAWDALLASCQVLRRRAAWTDACAAAGRLPRQPADVRRFLESRFVPLQILNPDASADGVVTGYFEPLLHGRLTRQPGFEIPVHGVPPDLLTFDWPLTPRNQRTGVVWLRRDGQTLVPGGRPGVDVRLDFAGFELDSKDRRLRIQLSSEGPAWVARPYPARAALAQAAQEGRWQAPVLAWVGDALGLYSMQIQGSGRIRLPDGRVLRLQFGEHNGQPFKPVRVVPRFRPTVQTRSLGTPPPEVTDAFEIESSPDASAASPAPPSLAPPSPASAAGPTADNPDVARETVEGAAAATSSGAPVRTRGLRPPTDTAQRGRSPGQDVDAMVDALLGGRQAAGRPTAGPSAGPAPRPPARPASPAAAPDMPASTPRVGTPPFAPPSSPSPLTRPRAPVAPAPPPAPGNTAASTPAASPPPVANAAERALLTDPSYVFFRLAPDQAGVAGPTGALGVPLTPGRSVAVDPRVTPLGYPVFLDAPRPPGASMGVQRLVLAQDTGGAIRGAVRADFFWGHGDQAGQLARNTRHQGRMWVLMPRQEWLSISTGGVRTRAIARQRPLPVCLVADENCTEDD